MCNNHRHKTLEAYAVKCTLFFYHPCMCIVVPKDVQHRRRDRPGLVAVARPRRAAPPRLARLLIRPSAFWGSEDINKQHKQRNPCLEPFVDNRQSKKSFPIFESAQIGAPRHVNLATSQTQTLQYTCLLLQIAFRGSCACSSPLSLLLAS